MAAFTIIDVVFTVGIAATLAAVGVPQLLSGADDMRAAAAARYVSARLQQTRLQAIRRNANTALLFSIGPQGYVIDAYLDGNGNGVLSRDIQSGVDTPIGAPVRVSQHFSGVEFGAGTALPSVDPSNPPPGTDPIRLGASDLAVFAPGGTASSGSIYLASRGGAHYVVRIFGETGRTRILKFHAGTGQWMPISGTP